MTGSRRLAIVPSVSLALLVSCAGQAPPAVPNKAPTSAEAEPSQPPEQALADAESALARSDYAAAMARFAAAKQSPKTQARATLGVARVQLVTGQYQQAAAAHAELANVPELAAEAALIKAQALRRQGQVPDAETFLRQQTQRHKAPELRLLLGEILLELGRRQDATPVLMTLIEDYNNDIITDSNGHGMSLVGRAAYLLRSPEDANDAFNQAEQVLVGHPQTLLWRAELFLEKYDPGHAEEVTSELLKAAPNHPEALVWMAHVKLAQAMDFAEAKRLAKQALTTNPNLARAYFVLAGLALRDMKLEEAEAHVSKGLAINPRDLDLMSMQATVRFLADDEPGFSRARDRVLKLNPQFSRFYQIVGEYAEWEHRYEEIVEMMREAVSIDDDDAKAYAQLGLNLIRSGDDSGGLLALRRSFAKDPYNVRVYNTLNLYEKTIAQSYTDVDGERFRFRYPSLEKPVLERYVPQLMDEAWNKFVGFYAYTPEQPVGVELYAERESFAIRTSGLPQTAIQGVCFGKTLASMSPRHEKFNVGMTLWHELAHVFHIQLSKNHVPRWFTEGLAEYETLVERTEWKREKDAELYAALRDQRLPKIGAMNEAFTHAEDLSDVTLAYYASTQIVKMLAEHFGRPKLNKMLVLWGEGKRTPEVIQLALGTSAEALDGMFANYVRQGLKRYDGQFIPVQRVGNPERVQKRAKAEPKNADAQARFALLALRSGDNGVASEAIQRALKLDPKHPDALWLKSRLALREGNHIVAQTVANKLVADGHDGYEVQIVLAKAALEAHDKQAQQQALERANSFDPLQSDPIYGLLNLAREAKDSVAEEKWLRQLHDLEEHDGSVYRDLASTLAVNNAADAVEVGKSAVYADMEDVYAHLAYAEALVQAKRYSEAEFEFESAILCPGPKNKLAHAHASFAGFLEMRGQTARGKKHRAKMEELNQAVLEEMQEQSQPE